MGKWIPYSIAGHMNKQWKCQNDECSPIHFTYFNLQKATEAYIRISCRISLRKVEQNDSNPSKYLAT